ncbi:MAG: starch synthase [Lentisphaeria bacterium]|jgi:starch synthase
MSDIKRILMIAAENDALPGAKVGGVGDVIRDLPAALIKQDAAVDVVLPSYGFLARLNNLENVGTVAVKFSSQLFHVNVLVLKGGQGRADNYILHHPAFAPLGETVYCNDSDSRPFATDATKFALFCSSVAQALVEDVLPRPDVLHCHDWHAAFLLILIRFGMEYRSLTDIKTIFTIHNLALQGIRPFRGDDSAFVTWFPDLRYSIDKISDPRYGDCVNPMRAGILLADRIHTVSPSYAQEIINSSHHELGIYGGDGLEHDIRERMERGDVIGILNGCEYPENVESKSLSRTKLAGLMREWLRRWAAKNVTLKSAHWLAEDNISHWLEKKSSGFTVMSVGRLTEQKIRVLHTKLKDGRSALQGLLDVLGGSGTMVFLGSGSTDLEKFFTEASAENRNLIFLNGYSDAVSSALYKFGDLFLMPSSFEPCGISQMLAMRSGQPCLVNSVGGLKDTVIPNKNGFAFEGRTINDQAEAMVVLFTEAITLYKNSKVIWGSMKQQAAKARFTWEASAKRYMEELY